MYLGVSLLGASLFMQEGEGGGNTGEGGRERETETKTDRDYEKVHKRSEKDEKELGQGFKTC